MTPRCGNCGRVLSDDDVAAGARFCSSCGSALGPSAQRAYAPAPAPAPAAPRIAAPSAPTGLRYAGFADRFVAWLVDTILLGVVNVALFFLFDQSGAGQGFTFLISAGYYIIGNGTGATLGKYTVGLRCVDANGEPPGLGRALVRYIISFFSALVLFLGYFWVLWNPEKRTWHDLVAGTYVIRL
jgi:uncharacterized RDD family membrane protein YckC